MVLRYCGLSPLARGTRRKSPYNPRPPPVYPRWRGEHGWRAYARGYVLRFIPAGAGNTPFKDAEFIQLPVYPRWRGEHEYVAFMSDSANGLSPLARGTRRAAIGGRTGKRFIPAGAGNTTSFVVETGSSTVYPRWRGEHILYVLADKSRRGLSPLARGTQRVGNGAGMHGRFIPAGAGNTLMILPRSWPSAVYPRWRGEHRNQAVFKRRKHGLSPLARGTH